MFFVVLTYMCLYIYMFIK